MAALEKVPEYVRVEEEERERRVREKRSKVSMCNSLSSILGSLFFLCFQVDKNMNKVNGFGSFKQRRKIGRENKRSRECSLLVWFKPVRIKSSWLLL